MKQMNLSEAEWILMNCLWNDSPKTIIQLRDELEDTTAWSKNVIITMLKRLESKGAVRHEEGQRAKYFFPAVAKEEIALKTGKGFLNRVYEGSLGLFVDAMVRSNSLTGEDIKELKEIIRKAEEEQ